VKRVPALDGLRGIAIAVVVVGHAFVTAHASVFANAGRGVDIFFVLSGFLITTLLLEGRYASLGSFYAARARRLLPALAVTLAVYLAVAHDMRALAASLLAVTYTANLAEASGHLSTMAALKHTWSLAEEEQFYLLWPAALLLVLRGRRRLAVSLLVAAIIAVTVEQHLLAMRGVSGTRLNEAPDTRSVGILVGCLLALTIGRLGRVALVAAPAALIVVSVGVLDPGFDLYDAGGLTVFCLSVAIVLARALDGGMIGRALAAAPLRSLGRISYSLYLYHYPILIGFGAYMMGSVGAKLAAVSLALVAATVSTWWLEEPIRQRRLRHKLCVSEGSLAELAYGNATSD
jgi:peptidoglycan/LPS O-acetylase OafA/YrhL